MVFRPQKIWRILIPIIGFSTISGSGQETPRKDESKKEPVRINLHSERARAETVIRLKTRADDLKSEAHEFARKNGLPVRGKKQDGTEFELIRIRDGRPVYFETDNDDAAISTATDLVRRDFDYEKVDGTGWIAGIWDAAGVRTTHQEFGGRATIVDGLFNLSDHSTHVAGTIGAAGVVARSQGMAPGVTLYAHNWGNDLAEVAALAATHPNQQETRIYVSNHSYGDRAGWEENNVGGSLDWYWTGRPGEPEDRDMGIYGVDARDWDAIAYDAPYFLQFRSAGNERNENPPNGTTVFISAFGGYEEVTYDETIHPDGDGQINGGYDSIPGDRVGKNIMTVSAVTDAVSGVTRNVSAAQMRASSSWGPTDDGRIKPDIVANGESVYSTEAGSDSDYSSRSGTSMSTPNASGSAILLHQLYRDQTQGETMRAATLKGLIIHTADDMGNPGPDYSFGWGLMNTAAAADLILSDASTESNHYLVEGILSNAVPVAAQTLVSDGIEPLIITLCWTDPAGTAANTLDDPTPRLVNDLDIRLTTPGGGTVFPFILDPANPGDFATTGDNFRDNVEQILVAAPEAGTYSVTVSHKGSLRNQEQAFSLITSGASTIPGNADLADRGAAHHAVSAPSIELVSQFTVEADVVNAGSEAAGPSRVQFYFSPDTEWDAGDILLAEKVLDPLGPGEFVPIDSSFIVPSRVTPGDYYLLWKIDSRRQIYESDETNNVAFYSTPVTVNYAPDTLLLYDVTFEEAKHVTGLPPALGGIDSPSAIESGAPEIYQSPNGNKQMRLQAPAVGPGSWTEAVRFDLAQGGPRYVLEMKVTTGPLAGQEEFRIRLNQGLPQDIVLGQTGATFPTVAEMWYDQDRPSGQPNLTGRFHEYFYSFQSDILRIEVDVDAETWKIFVDGEEKHSGPFHLSPSTPDVQTLHLSLYDNNIADEIEPERVDIDNIRATVGPPRPRFPTVTATNGDYVDRIEVSWPEDPHALIYRLYRNTIDDFSTATEIILTENQFVDFEAIPGEYTYYWVRTENGAGISDFSPTAQGLLLGPPVQPQNINVTRSIIDRIRVSWEWVSYTDSYEIYRSETGDFTDGVLVQTVDRLNTSWEDFYGDPGQEFRYRVYAVNAAGSSPPGVSGWGQKLGPPDATDFLRASDGTHAGYIHVNWHWTESTQSSRVVRSETNDLATAQELVILTLSEGANYQDTAVVPGRTYYYWVQHINQAGAGPFSELNSGFALAPPGAPENLSASGGLYTDKITLNWSSVPDVEYEVFRNSVSVFAGASLIATTTSGSYTDTSAAPGMLHYYWVRAENEAGHGDPSAPANGHRRLIAPAGISASNSLFSDRIRITWNPVAGGTEYEIYRSENSWSIGSLIATTSGNSYDDTSVTQRNLYHYRVLARSTILTDSAYSTASSGFSTISSPPNLATSTGLFEDYVRITWDPTPDAQLYRLYRSTSNDPSTARQIMFLTETEFIDTTASAGVSYYYWIRVDDGDFLSPLETFSEGFRATAPPFVPDVRIGSNPSATTGQNVVSSTGVGQRLRLKSKKGRKRVFYLCVENDGTLADEHFLRGSRGNRFFKPGYWDSSGRNMTAETIAGTYGVNLDPAEKSNFRLEVKPARSAIGKRKRRTFVFSATAFTDPRKMDAVQALAETKKAKKKKR